MSSMTVSGPLYYLAPDALRAAKEEAPSFRTLFPELGVLGDRVENMLGTPQPIRRSKSGSEFTLLLRDVPMYRLNAVAKELSAETAAVVAKLPAGLAPPPAAPDSEESAMSLASRASAAVAFLPSGMLRNLFNWQLRSWRSVYL